MLIAVYARVSTEEQARTGFSLPEQRRACRRHAEALAAAAGEPATVVEFTDDTSGEILERPGLQTALARLRQGGVSVFVCLDPDRLARRLMLQLLVTEQIEATGCRLEFVQHDYQETAEGRLFYQMRGAIAEYEKAKILERTARGQRGKIAAGGLPHVVRMYGYRFVKGAGKQATAREMLVPDQREAEWVGQIYGWCAGEQIGPARIAARLHALGVATKTGRGMWRNTQVQRILRHPAYATGRLALGTRDHRGIAVARRLSREQRRQKGLTLTARPRPAQEWQYVEIEPIVAVDVWRRVQEVLDSFRVGARASGGRGCTRPLSGLGRCGLCGGPLYYLNGSKIVCAARYRHAWSPGRAPAGCTLPAKSRTAVEAAVWQQLEGWLLDPGVVAGQRRLLGRERANPPRSGDAAELAALRRELQCREAELARLGTLYVRGLWPAEQALPAAEAVNRQIGALRSRLTDLAGRPATGDPSGLLLSRLSDQDLLAQVQITFRTLTAGQRAELLRAALDHYQLFPSPRGATPAVLVVPRP